MGKSLKDMEIPQPSFFTFDKICAIAESTIGHDNIKVIFEFGARYGEDTVEFAKRYKNASIYSFECNENTINQCRQYIKGFKNIVLTNKAVCDYDGFVKFYPIDKEKTITTWIDGNQGASSIMKASGKYEIEQYVQKETTVPCIRLDTFMNGLNINQIDVLWMDVQGAELAALKGLGDRLNDVVVIQCEVELMEIYTNQPLFYEIKKYLKRHGFCFMGFTSKSEYSGDAVFIQKDKITADCKSLCKMVLLPDLLLDSQCGKTRIKLINRFLRLLRRFRQFGYEFPVFTPVSEEDSIIDWYRQVFDPLIGKDVQFRYLIKSNVALDVVIPVAEKDIKTLGLCIESIRKNLRHAIYDIYIVAPNNAEIKELAKNYHCKFIQENAAVRGVTKEEIQYSVNGLDRSGWLFQQLIKLSVDEFTQHEYILVMDSDTFLNRPIKYFHKGKMILNTSDEHHEPYYDVYKKLMQEGIVSNKSFVAHGMLFSREILGEMKLYIANKNHKNWASAILDNVDYRDISGFSEYETYGNYILRYHPTKVKTEYWFNKSINNFEELSNIPKFYKTVSLHSYRQTND